MSTDLVVSCFSPLALNGPLLGDAPVDGVYFVVFVVFGGLSRSWWCLVGCGMVVSFGGLVGPLVCSVAVLLCSHS